MTGALTAGQAGAEKAPGSVQRHGSSKQPVTDPACPEVPLGTAAYAE